MLDVIKTASQKPCRDPVISRDVPASHRCSKRSLPSPL